MDIVIEVDRFPRAGETVVTQDPKTGKTVPGGKGANQAVAAARFTEGTGRRAQFVCQFGNDAFARTLEQTLGDHKVDISGAGHSREHPSGQGYVLLQPDGGVSSIVIGGSNAAWPGAPMEEGPLRSMVRGAAAVMLQREVPEHVNEAVAAEAHAAGVPVIHDVGGEDRPISDALLRLVTYLAPNLSELRRLSGLPIEGETDEEVVAAARALQARGARSVLVTLGSRGSILVPPPPGGEGGGAVLRQAPFKIPGATGKVVDETGAGDCYRAAFAVALVEGRPLQECMHYASAAGALAASRMGAVPAIPSRRELDALAAQPGMLSASASASASAATATGDGNRDAPPADTLRFASRLSAMKERRDLWAGGGEGYPLSHALGMVARQSAVKGLHLVDFNYPQHLDGLSYSEVRAALAAAGLGAGAVCLRYPESMRLGTLTHPDAAVRAAAINMTIQAGVWARELGATQVVVWSAFDGYDYSFQVDYTVMWRNVVEGFQAVCDALPDIKVSLEFKPTDENTRFFAVPTTGAALLLVEDIARANMGLTLDVGHLLAAGENPAQSAALAGARGKLFGVQLNDGYQRIGAEDGLMFGSVHPLMALEFLSWLQRTSYAGHIYFDVFPRNEDPVREAEYNIRAPSSRPPSELRV